MERYDQEPNRLICVEIGGVIIINLHVQNNTSVYLLQSGFYKDIIVSVFQDYNSFALKLGMVSRVVYSCMGLLCVYGRGIQRFSVRSTQTRVIWRSAAKDS